MVMAKQQFENVRNSLESCTNLSEYEVESIMQLITQYKNDEITNVLDRLDNAIFSDGFPRMVLAKLMQSIAEERKKLL